MPGGGLMYRAPFRKFLGRARGNEDFQYRVWKPTLLHLVENMLLRVRKETSIEARIRMQDRITGYFENCEPIRRDLDE